jgi:hypothetical protein
MNIAITGHTSGLGKSLYDSLNNTIGFSRSNGYDIEYNIDDIVADCSGVDIFINNAYNSFDQVELLYALFDKYPNMQIINISSNSSDGIKNKIHKYAINKAALDKASEQFFALGYNTTNLKFGWIDTPRVTHKNVDKLSTEYVVGVINWVINQKHRVKELNISP